DEVETAAAALAHRLIERHGAPGMPAALAAANEEIGFAASLADHPVGTVIALQRTIDPDRAVRERFRAMRRRAASGANTFAQGCVLPIGIAPDDPAADAAVEEVDLVGLMTPDESQPQPRPPGKRPS